MRGDTILDQPSAQDQSDRVNDLGAVATVRPDELAVSLPLVVSVLSATCVVAMGVVAYCTWRCWRTKRDLVSRSSSLDMSSPSQRAVISPLNLKISQSVPDLVKTNEAKPDLVRQEELIGKSHYKTVIKQSTLPTVPQRHQTFQRQLSHKLDLSAVEFSIHSMKYTEQPTVGRLKPELYRQNAHEGHLHQENAQTCGKLNFSLIYDQDSGNLVVNVISAEGLPAKDFSGTSDPYVKIYLLPDRKRKFQTKVHRKTLYPEFNESFTFNAPFSELGERMLQFSIYDFDRFSRHDLIGVVMLKDIVKNQDLSWEKTYTKDIICVQQEKVDLGELLLSLCYLPTAGRLTVTIIKARNLKAMDITGTSDPYVKVSLMCRGKRIKKKKTSVKRNTLNPVYNEAIVFDVPNENVDEVSIVIKVVDYDRVGSNELMGCTAVGLHYIGPGRDHWFEMLENQRKPVAQWYPLQENVPGTSNEQTPNGRNSIPAK